MTALTTETLKTKKITLATLKSFAKNREGLFTKELSHFDGMVDGVRTTAAAAFTDVNDPTVYRRENDSRHTLDLPKVYLVLGGGDYFEYFQDENYFGIKVYNCCGSFIIARKNAK